MFVAPSEGSVTSSRQVRPRGLSVMLPASHGTPAPARPPGSPPPGLRGPWSASPGAARSWNSEIARIRLLRAVGRDQVDLRRQKRRVGARLAEDLSIGGHEPAATRKRLAVIGPAI